MLDSVHETTAAGNPKQPPPELYLEWVQETWYDGVTKDNVSNSFKACGIGAIGAADDHLIHCLEDGNGIPNGLYGQTKAHEAAEAQELAEILHGFKLKLRTRTTLATMSDLEVVDDEPVASDKEGSETGDENHKLSDDSDF